MEKTDYKRIFKTQYSASAKEVTFLHVPCFNFLMIDGHGDPDITPAYQQAVEALFSLSYALKFAIKHSPAALDYTVMPLEGLWWVDDLQNLSDRNQWQWTMMIMQSEVLTPALFTQTRAELQKKKSLPALDSLRLESFCEGECAQILHIGSYKEEAPTIEKLHTRFLSQGYHFRGKHHEIYLGDPRKSTPEKLKTILRQPIEK